MSPSRFLRSPRVIVAEAAAFALAILASATVTQRPGPADRARLEADHPLVAALVRALGLDDVLGSAWFLAVVLLAAASLGVVLREQWSRLAREWRAPLGERHFRSAPYRREFTRPARGGAEDRAEFRTTGRLGSAGSAVFHLGLLVVAGAGLVRMLFAVEAVVDLHEGERLEPVARAYGAQWAGPLAAPFAFPVGVELGPLRIERYPSGALEQLSAPVRLDGDPGGAPRLLGVNRPLERDGRTLYLTQELGVAAFVELTSPEGTRREVYLLAPGDGGEFRVAAAAAGRELRLRAPPATGARPAPAIQVRVLRGGALLGVSQVGVGERVPFPDGSAIRVEDVRWWARLRGARDVSVVPAYLGFALVLLGAVIMFGIVRVDTAVVVTREGDRERVLVALWPRRFAPMFAERFRRLVEREGGPVPGKGEP